MLAEILSVGTELLIGQVVNTNATFLAQELARLGVDLHRVVTVGDNMDRLVEALEVSVSRADVVLCTGGLGPTPDDITVEAMARYLGEPLAVHPEALAHIEAYFARRGRDPTALDRKQALFPPSAELIPNPAGTAFGLCVRPRGGPMVLAFPGVPSELRTMWDTWAAPRLAREAGSTIQSRLLKFCGLSEADLAEYVRELFDGENPTVAPYTASGEIHLRLTAKAASARAAEALLDPLEEEVMRRAGRYYFGRDDETLPAVVGARLRAARQTLALAESATGGLLASRITDVPGSTDYFLGGVVAYSVAAKVELLGVARELVDAHGAVSRETTEAMARCARALLHSDWAIATTGFASPGPGTPDERVGEMHVAIGGPDGRVSSREYRFGRHPRELVKHFATQRALDILLRRIEEADGRARP